MDRRTFLQWGSAGVAGAALPGWLLASFQNPVRGRANRDGMPALRAAFQDASAQGRPLLVLVIPEDVSLRWEAGTAWAQLLQSGPTAALADLALCDVACATVQDLHRELPDLPGLPVAAKEAENAREPIAILLETDAPRASIVEGAIEVLPVGHWYGEEEKEREYVKKVEQRIAALSESLRAVIAPDLQTRRRRARQAMRSSGIQLAELDWDGSTPFDDQWRKRAERAPAIAYLALDPSEQDGPLLALLASFANARLTRESPTGAQWAESTGCGIRCEGDENDMRVACGMGYVPEISRRFLHFYNK